MIDLCAAGRIPTQCCVGDPWADVFSVMHYGEPLDPAVISAAEETGVDPHELDWHVRAIHGWESHDSGYATHVAETARRLRHDGCGHPS